MLRDSSVQQNIVILQSLKILKLCHKQLGLNCEVHMGKNVKDIQEREKGKRKGKDIVVMYYIHLFCPLLVYHESLGSK